MKKIFLLSIIVSFLISCKQDQEFRIYELELQAALQQASPTNNMSYFKLPDSDQYARIPQDPKNPITAEKVALGKMLYHDPALGTDPKYPEGKGTYSCATCHHAGGGFQSGMAQAIGDGGIGFGTAGEERRLNPIYNSDSIDVQPIRTPTVLNSAYQKLMLWNGQFGATGDNTGTEAHWTPGTPKATNNLGYEGVEIQAIAGLKVHRMDIDQDLINNSDYKLLFDYAFPNVPESERYTREYAGLAIAAFERTVMANEAPFQQYLKGKSNALTDNQKAGAIVFFTKGKCTTCHTGPALNSEGFHALGMNDLDKVGFYGSAPDQGTKEGRGGFTKVEKDMFCFKVPQLYSLSYSPHYGHGATFNSINSIIRYKANGIKENNDVPDEYLSPYFKPLDLTEREINQLTDFIENGLKDANLSRYEPSYLPSGLCFPNNDPISKLDLGCQ